MTNLPRPPRALTTACIIAVALLVALATAMCTPVTPPTPTPAPAETEGAADAAPPLSLPNGIASGDVTSTSVVLWARADAPGVLTFTWGTDLAQAVDARTATIDDALAPVTVAVAGLTPGAAYQYQVTTASGASQAGRFRTPAPPGVHQGLRFGVSGDWRGDLTPFPALKNAPDRDLAFFVALGDEIYADIPSPAVPDHPATTLAEFYAKYAESLTPREGVNYWADLRAAAPLFAVIDDHEVVDNFSGGAPAADDPRFGGPGRVNQSELYRTGMAAFEAYMPLAVTRYGEVPGDDGRMAGAPDLYRYRTFGDAAALFVVDMRSFRDPPLPKIDPSAPGDVARFTADSFDPARTVLGKGQLARLQADLLAAQQAGVTWKFVALPDPIQLLDRTSAHDRFEGYAAERTELLRFIAERGITNVVFIAADIHGTLVNDLSYQATPDGAHLPVAAWEITVSPAAMWAPYGPTKVFIYENEGRLSEAEVETYRSLPVRNDMDSAPDDRDDFVKAALDAQLAELGHDPIGLLSPEQSAESGAPVSATLLEGDYIASHVYGWTEFEIDPVTQALTVTTWGIPPYAELALGRDPAEVARRTPEVVSRFVVEKQSP